MNRAQLQAKLAAIPMSTLLPAFRQLTGDTTSTVSRSQVVQTLAQAIEAGQVPMASVLNGAPRPAQASPAPAAAPQAAPQASVDPAVIQKIIGRLHALEQGSESVTQALGRINTSTAEAQAQARTEAQAIAASVGSEFKSLRTQVQALSESMGQIKVDPLEVSKAVTQVVAETFRPFAKRVEEVGAQAAVGEMVKAQVVARRSALDVFGIDLKDRKGDDVMVDIWDHADAPAVDPYYLWTRDLLCSMLLTNKVWLGGPKGTGKTEAARQFAARTGRKVVRYNFRKFTTAEDYIGSTGLTQGNTVFSPGPVLAGLSTPGTVVLLDELTNIDPGEAAPLNGLLEPSGSVTIGGRSWSLAPGVMVVAADNTLGNGDDSGRYAGTRPMNSALVDRFDLMVRMDYLPRDMEVTALMTHTGCKKELAGHVIDAVRLCREKVGSGELVDAPSIRSCIAFVRALRLLSVPQAWEAAIANRQPTEGALALEAVFTASIDQTLVNSLI